MWQKCPNCEGSGKVFYPLSNSTHAVCTVCEGKKIINQLTGLPPKNIEFLTPDTIKDKAPLEQLENLKPKL